MYHIEDIDYKIKYILEEITSVPVLDVYPVFIVYPFETAEPFKLALQLLNDLEQIPRREVIWMQTPIDESNFQPHLAKPDNMKLLFKAKEKNLYFIMCPDKKYYNIKHLTVLLNMFATAVADCAELVNQEGNAERLETARGPWHITVVIADTLQAFNDDNYVNVHKQEEIKEDLRKEGKKLIEDAKKVILSKESFGRFAVQEVGDQCDAEHKSLIFTAGQDISVTVNIMNWEKHRNSNKIYAENNKLLSSLYHDPLTELSLELTEKIPKKKIDIKKKIEELRNSIIEEKKIFEERKKRENQVDGDRAFHALFGKWNGRQIVCDHVAKKRKEMSDKIRICQKDVTLFGLVKEAIIALIMKGKSTASPIIKIYQDKYEEYLKLEPKQMHLAWEKFNKILENENYKNIMKFIEDFCKKYCASNSIAPQSLTALGRFQACLNKSDSLRGRISYNIELNNAFLQFKKECAEAYDYDWEIIFANHPQIIDEYANIIEKSHTELDTEELRIISYVFNLTIDYYIKNPDDENSLPRKFESISQGKLQTVSICFNGIHHYVKMTSNGRLPVAKTESLQQSVSDGGKFAQNIEITPRDTAARGDCAFHAIFGEWRSNIFYCDNVARKRRALAKTIRECQKDSVLLTLVKEAIMALIMENKTTNSLIIKSIQEAHKKYLQLAHDRMQSAWNEFDKTLQKYTNVTDFIKDFCIKHCAKNSIKFENLTDKLQFDTCFNESEILGPDSLKSKISSITELNNAFLQFVKECKEEYNWNQLFLNHPHIINEYADFIEKPGNELIAQELKIIGYVFNLTIDYYIQNPDDENFPPRKIKTLSEGKLPVISIYFNGINHYQKMASDDQLPVKLQWVFHNIPQKDELYIKRRLLYVQTSILGLNQDIINNNTFAKTKLRGQETFVYNYPDSFNEASHVMRYEISDRLNRIFERKPKAGDAVSIVVCHGRSGVGKSHLTDSYLKSSQLLYKMIIRIHADGPYDMMNSFKQITENLKMHKIGQNLLHSSHQANKLNKIREDLLKWFDEDENAGWILVFDNLDNYDKLKEFIPYKGGHVLITSQQIPQNNNWSQGRTVHYLPIGNMNDKEAVELLQKTSGRKDPDFKKVAEKLENLAFALHKAGEFFRDGSQPHNYFSDNLQDLISQFIEEIEQDSLDKLDIELSGVNKTVVESSLISINKISQKLGPENSQLMKELLIVCAYLAPHNIPISILCFWFCFTHGTTDEMISLFFELIDHMANHSLIKYDIDSSSTRTLFDTFSMHSLDQKILRAQHKLTFKQDPAAYSNWFDRLYFTIECIYRHSTIPNEMIDSIADPTSYFLKKSFKFYDNFISYYNKTERKMQARLILLPHMLALKNAYNRYCAESIRLVDLNILIGQIQFELGNINETFESSVKELKAFRFANITPSIESGLRNQDEQMDYFSLRERQIADVHKVQQAQIINLYLKLFIFYNSNGQYHKAAHILDSYKPPNIEDSANLNFMDAVMLTFIADNHVKTGEIYKGIEIFEKIYPVLRSNYDKSSSIFAGLKIIMANSYCKANKLFRAKKFAEDAVKVLKIGNDQGAEDARFILAKVLIFLEKFEDAKSLLEQSIIEIKSSYPEGSIQIFHSCQLELILGMTYCQQKNYVRGSKLLVKTLPLVKSMYGNQAPIVVEVSQYLDSISKILESLNGADPAQGIRNAAASTGGDTHALKELLSAYPELVNEADNSENKYTALHLAVEAGNRNAIRLLLAAGAKMYIPDARGKTALQHAVEKWQNDNNNVDILDMLLGTMRDEFILQDTLMNIGKDFVDFVRGSMLRKNTPSNIKDESQSILEQKLDEFILSQEDSFPPKDVSNSPNNLNQTISRDAARLPINDQLPIPLVSAHIIGGSMSTITNQSSQKQSVETPSREQFIIDPTTNQIGFSPD